MHVQPARGAWCGWWLAGTSHSPYSHAFAVPWVTSVGCTISDSDQMVAVPIISGTGFSDFFPRCTRATRTTSCPTSEADVTSAPHICYRDRTYIISHFVICAVVPTGGTGLFDIAKQAHSAFVNFDLLRGHELLGARVDPLHSSLRCLPSSTQLAANIQIAVGVI